MFQRCLLHGAGYASYAKAAPSRDLYRKYAPVLEKLFRRRWVFDPKPIELPIGYEGNVFRGRSGSLLASIVSHEPRLPGRKTPDNSVCIRCSGVEGTTRMLLHSPGEPVRSIPFKVENGALQFDVPGNTVAAIAQAVKGA
jgi:hypothetical protein